ncbi:family 20 glycosylhydrolase [Aestuariicella hydrocarbonica]|uniref:beta-N-acetylhexosaminidase n=1 Tax=Pseudomaricurvus hydrocarbonicus TaxID=1470433 RepID=A0A9E5JZ27_9GAMM|nr:family 20 glycosylhydrolase [Aestuariicella hydrocarbonica]NHO65027.1 family 20 glycosylhydrolase [Aestuariicella hydrocarbonica]
MPTPARNKYFKKTALALLIPALATLTTLTGCQLDTEASAINLDQHALANMAQSLKVRYQVLDNRTDAGCDSERSDGFCFRGQLSLSSPEGISSKDWVLYFSDMTPIQSVEGNEFTITHLNGDLHQLKPGKDFQGITAGETVNIQFRGSYWHLSKTDIMPNYYLLDAAEQLKPEIVRSTIPVTDADTGLEILPHAGDFTDLDKQLKRTPEDQTSLATSSALFEQTDSTLLDRQQLASAIIPTPKQVNIGSGELSLDQGISLQGDVPGMASLRPALDELQRYGISHNNVGVPITFKQLTPLADTESAALNADQTANTQEWYRLEVKDSGIRIEMYNATGAAYALRTLASLMFVDSTRIPLLTVTDSPRYAFRGMHLDVSRNFRDKHYVIKLLEQMSRYKLNRLHLHLGDDEGWRVAIRGLPELTDIGSRRCHDPAENHCLMPQLGSGPAVDNPANGHYSRADYIEILQAAQARHIEVIPSFDMPGHSRAAVVSMEARYRRLIAEEKYAEANQYRLLDPQDTTQYESIQFYHDNTLNVCLDSSYRFVNKVINEVINLHRDAGVPLTRYHIGADETAGAWIASPACQALLNDDELNLNTAHDLTGYFVEKVANLVANKGIVPAGWNDGMSATRVHNMPAAVQSNAWTPLFWDGHKSAHEQANRQWQVVISTPDATYFDFPHAADPLERGYYWASRGTSTEKVFQFMPDNLPAHAASWTDRQGRPMTLDDGDSHLNPKVKFYGLQGHLWTEVTRTDEQADYMMFPRLTALAERAWHQADWEVDYNHQGQTYSSRDPLSDGDQRLRQQQWNRFANTLAQKELPKLDQYNVHYRIPTVGAKLSNGVLEIKAPLPGLPLEYQDGDSNWHPYSAPVNVSGKVHVRAQSANGQRNGRALAAGSSLKDN